MVIKSYVYIIYLNSFMIFLFAIKSFLIRNFLFLMCALKKCIAIL